MVFFYSSSILLFPSHPCHTLHHVCKKKKPSYAPLVVDYNGHEALGPNDERAFTIRDRAYFSFVSIDVRTRDHLHKRLFPHLTFFFFFCSHPLPFHMFFPYHTYSHTLCATLINNPAIAFPLGAMARKEGKGERVNRRETTRVASITTITRGILCYKFFRAYLWR